MGHGYKGILFSHKKEWNNATCSNIDGPRHYHTKWSKTEKDKHHMVLCICWFLKIKRERERYKQTYIQNKTNLKTWKTNLWLPKGKSKGGKLGVWD